VLAAAAGRQPDSTYGRRQRLQRTRTAHRGGVALGPARRPLIWSAPMASPTPRILLVEDDPSLALGLCDTLEFEGFHVTHARTGQDGIHSAQKERPDCIILDLMLPDTNGYRVCELIRKDDPVVPIIMLTARSQEADKIRGLDVGADDYVTKPFSVGELVARIRAIFR